LRQSGCDLLPGYVRLLLLLILLLKMQLWLHGFNPLPWSHRFKGTATVVSAIRTCYTRLVMGPLVMPVKSRTDNRGQYKGCDCVSACHGRNSYEPSVKT
jgi:hypothetical protein